jgi:hypothetical protein
MTLRQGFPAAAEATASRRAKPMRLLQVGSQKAIPVLSSWRLSVADFGESWMTG